MATRQKHLDGMEPKRIEPVHAAALEYHGAIRTRKAAGDVELNALTKLRRVMGEHGIDSDHGYLDDELKIIVPEVGDPKPKVKLLADEGNGDGSGDG